MKILQVTHRFYPSSGGGAYVVYSISQYLQDRGNKVTIITSDYNFDENYVSKLRKQGINILLFQRKLSISHFIISSGMDNWLKENIMNYDIIHLHNARTYQNYVVIKYAKMYNIPVVLHAHGSMERIGNKQILKRIYDTFFLKSIILTVSTFIALSESEKNAYLRMGVPSEKISVLPNGINIEDYKELPKKGIFREKYNIYNGKRILLYIGRIDESKGIDLLIKAYKLLLQEERNLILVIAGRDTGFKNKVLRIISDFNLEKEILFLDYISERDKLCAFVDSAIFITPRFYGFPITFLEACSCGLPVITTDNGDYLDWINDNIGYCTKFDEIDLAAGIKKIITNDEKRDNFSNNGRWIVRDLFNWEKIVGDLMDIYAMNLIIKD